MLPQQDPDAVDLRHYLRVLRRRKWLIIFATGVTVATAVGLSLLQTPMYQSTAQVLLSSGDQSVFNPVTGQRNDPARLVATEIEVLESEPIRDAVTKRIGRPVPRVDGASVGQTDVIAVTVTDVRPARAARIANAYAEEYIAARRNQAVSSLLEAGKEIQARVDSLDADLASLEIQAAALSSGQQAGAQGQGLAARRTALINQRALFQQKLDQLGVDAALKNGGAQIVTPASVPDEPSSPRPKRNAALALVVGLMLGTGVAFLRERLDDTIKDKDDVAAAVGGLPVLGLIPTVPDWKDRDRELVITEVDPKSIASEAYRTLRTSVQFMGLDRPLNTLQVTSPSASEGKSTTLVNLAVSLARAGLRVIVVDCDLRRPRAHRFFDLPNEVGFTSLLLGEAPVSEALQQVPQEERLFLLASGPVPPNPSELLSGRRTIEVLAALQTAADIVLIDCPPVLPVTDAAVLSARVDATLLVATAGQTTVGALRRSVELLRQVEAPLIGMVLNAVKAGDSYGYGGGYGYAPYYGERPKSGSRSK